MNKRAIVKSMFIILSLGILALILLTSIVVALLTYTTDVFRTTFAQTDDGASWERGETINLHEPYVSMISCKVVSGSHLPNQSKLYNGSRSLISIVGASGAGLDTFNHTAPGTYFNEGVFYIVFGHGGEAYSGRYNNGGTSYPVTGTNIDYLTSAYVDGENGSTSESYHILNCTTVVGSPDSTPPYFTNIPSSTSINYTQGFGVYFNASDETQIGTFKINWTTNFTINSTGYLTNSTANLAVGNYYINVSVNDTSNNVNSTIYWVNITDRTPPSFIGIPSNITKFTDTYYSGGFGVYFNATDNYQLGTFAINWTTNFTINSTGYLTNSTPNIYPGQYYINVSINDSLNNLNSVIYLVNITSYLSWQESLNDQLKAYWAFEEVSSPTPNLVDGNNYNSTSEINITRGLSGIIGNSVNLSNDNSQLNFSDLSMNLASAFTLAGWIYWDVPSGSDDGSIFTYAEDGNNMFSIYMDAKGTLSSVLTLNSINQFSFTGIAIPRQTWVFIAIQMKDGNATFWTNGSIFDEDSSVAYSGQYSPTKFINFGKKAYASFPGRIDEFGWWDRFLTPDEMTNLYNSGGAMTYIYTDTVNPIVSILYPSNNGNYTVDNLDVNYTATDFNISSCWYSNDSMAVNISLTNCKTNITEVIWTQGQHNVTIWANDSTGNLGSSSVTFNIDSIFPNITIVYPINNSNYSNINLDINYTTSDEFAGIDSCWYSNDSYSVNTSLTNCLENITTVTWSEGTHNVRVYANDTLGNINFSSVRFTIDTINPNVSILFPINNSNYSNANLDINFTAEDINLNYCWYSNDSYSVNTTLSACENITNVVWADGQHNVTIWANDSAGNSNFSRVSFTIDATPPSCILLSKIPNNIEDNSTGVLSFVLNCTDYSGINLTKIGDHYPFFITRTVDAFVLAPGIPNYWSNRYPNNSLGVIGTLTPAYQIWRALGRNEGYWYDSLVNSNLTDCTGIFPCYRPLNDTFSYAIEDGEYGHFTVTPENSANTSVIINYTHPAVEISAFRQSVYLSYENMINESKKNYSISINNYVLMKRFDAEAYRGTKNYTMNSLRNFAVTGSPTKTLRSFYCNSSYNPTGAIQVVNSPNCVLINSLTSIELNNIVFTEENSSYSKGTYAITDGFFGGIVATAEFYIEYESPETATGKRYELRYVNGSTNTNVRFNDTKVAWITTNGGTTWTQAPWTPDVFTTSVRSADDEFNFGYYISDKFGNVGHNFTLVVDDITLTNHPISFPIILEYNNSVIPNDVNLNGTHKTLMNIRVGVSKDPDSIGNVTHNLTLRNIDGSWNYTINGSFKSFDDRDLWLTFNTSLVPDGSYRMNITAYSGDNVLDVKSRTTDRNFTIDNTYPETFILYPPSGINISDFSLDVNYTATDIHLQSCWYSNDSMTINISLTNCQTNITNVVWADGQHNVTIWANDSANNINYSVIKFTIDTYDPSGNLTYPLNNSLNNSIVQNFTVNISDNLGIQNATLSIFNSTGLFNQTSISFAPGLQTTYLGIVVYVIVDGIYQWVYSIWDWAGNTFTTQNNTLTIDTVVSLVSILYPSNNTYTLNNNLDINYTTSDEFAGIDSCWYSNDSYSVNTSLTNCLENITTVTWSEGTHNVRVYANDTLGNINFSSVRFTIDTINPNVSILFPINNSNYSNANLDINFTAEDINLNYCWYSNDSYSVNTTLSACENITNVVWADGQHNVTIWANDSAGNSNFSRVSFTIDATPPVSTATAILSNGTSYTFGEIATTSVNITISAFDSLIGFNNLLFPKYCIDTLNTCTPNTYIGTGVQVTADGTSYIRFYANDTLNNQETTQSKTIIIDQMAELNITSPVNNSTTTSTTLEINYTLSNYGLSEICWYTNDSGINNYTITCGENITGRTWNEGINIVSVYVNSSGLINYDSVTFTLDTTAPDIEITSPISNSNYVNNSGIELNYSVHDVSSSIENCWYYVYNSSGSISKSLTILPTCSNTTFSLPRGNTSYTVYVFTQDELDNINSASSTFFINVVPPTISLIDANDTHKNYADNHTFNFTVFTNSLSIDTCELWGDFNGTWGLNQSKTDASLSVQNAFNSVSLQEGNYKFNVRCNDSIDFYNWSTNSTYSVDLTNPNLTLLYATPYDATQNLNFNVSVSDSNPYTNLSCFYTLFNSAGNVDGLNRNISFVCNNDTSATATDLGLFNISVYVYDKANNFNQSSKTFTLTSGGTGGGGGGVGEATSSTVCLTSTGNVTNFVGLQRCILYARIREACSGTVGCVLSKSSDLLAKLSSQTVKINISELMLWVEKYNANELEVLKIPDSDVKLYNLFTGIIQIDTLRFAPIPQRLDPFYYFILSKEQLEYYPIKFNRLVQNISTLKGSYPGFSGKLLTNSTSIVYLNISDYDFVANTFTGMFEYTSTEGETTFQEVQFRVFNLLNPWTGVIFLFIILGIIILVLLRKKIRNIFKKIKLYILRLFKKRRKRN